MRDRPTWKDVFVQITNVVAERSSCTRVQVGAVLVKENRIISMGYNGVPHGQKHCDEYFEEKYDSQINSFDFPTLDNYFASPGFYKEHGEFSVRHELHAEENVLSFAAKNGIGTKDAIMYVSYTPCVSCAKLILQCGIKEVYYIHPYDRDMSGKAFLEENGIKCEQV
jgi:dCMP deaminase